MTVEPPSTAAGNLVADQTSISPSLTTAGIRWSEFGNSNIELIQNAIFPILALILASVLVAFMPSDASSEGRHGAPPPAYPSISSRLEPITRYLDFHPIIQVASAALNRPIASSRPSQSVFGGALNAATCAASLRLTTPKRMIGIIDYSRPSIETRLWIYDRLHNKIIRSELVAHGKNSGDDLATSFSNSPGSLMSSLGLFETGEIYNGEHGISLRLHGLEPNINDLAYDRAIVLHGAPYVSKRFIQKHARLGRSWGCPAVREEVAAKVIDELQGDKINGGAFLFSYFPDRSWLRHSKVLNGCGA